VNILHEIRHHDIKAAGRPCHSPDGATKGALGGQRAHQGILNDAGKRRKRDQKARTEQMRHRRNNLRLVWILGMFFKHQDASHGSKGTRDVRDGAQQQGVTFTGGLCVAQNITKRLRKSLINAREKKRGRESGNAPNGSMNGLIK